MSKQLTVGLLGLLFGLVLMVYAAPVHAAESDVKQDLAVLQQALNGLESVLQQLSVLVAGLQNVALTPEMKESLVAMDTALNGIAGNLVELNGSLAKLTTVSGVTFGAALPAAESLTGEAVDTDGKSFLASLNFTTVAIPSIVAVLGIVILTFAFVGRKSESEAVAS